MRNGITPFFFEPIEPRRHFTVVTVTGTSGADVVITHISGVYLQVTLNGTTTNYTGVTGISVAGGGGNDYIDTSACTRNATVSGSSGNDTINTGSGDDQITGGDGDDVVYAFGGNDTINGNNGVDSIFGGDGADYLYGGTGADQVDSTLDGNDDQFVDHLFANDAAGTNDGATDILNYSGSPAPIDIVKFDGSP